MGGSAGVDATALVALRAVDNAATVLNPLWAWLVLQSAKGTKFGLKFQFAKTCYAIFRARSVLVPLTGAYANILV